MTEPKKGEPTEEEIELIKRYLNEAQQMVIEDGNNLAASYLEVLRKKDRIIKELQGKLSPNSTKR